MAKCRGDCQFETKSLFHLVSRNNSTKSASMAALKRRLSELGTTSVFEMRYNSYVVNCYSNPESMLNGLEYWLKLL